MLMLEFCACSVACAQVTAASGLFSAHAEVERLGLAFRDSQHALRLG